MDITQNNNFRNIFFNKIFCDLSDAIYHPHGQEVWIINFDTKEWFFEYQNNGQLWYNQKIFSVNLPLFSINTSENQKLLKYWFEKHLKLTVNKISRKNSNMDYYIEGIMENTKYKWSINERYGFSYSTIKNYLDIKTRILDENVKLSQFLDEI